MPQTSNWKRRIKALYSASEIWTRIISLSKSSNIGTETNFSPLRGKGEKYFVDSQHVPLNRYGDHFYTALGLSTYGIFKPADRLKLHVHFQHQSDEKLSMFLKRANLQEELFLTLWVLQGKSNNFESYWDISWGLIPFCIAFGAEIVTFNYRILMDIIYLYRKPVLRIFKEEKEFRAARFLPSTSWIVWNVFGRLITHKPS